jgi:two-component system, chemotaxis family, response regulator Rcp1
MSNHTAARHIEILMVEDNPVDAMLTREAFELSRLYNTLNVVEDGVAAMAYLRREGAYAATSRPDLVLLDVNLPKKNGIEVLAEIKSDPVLRYIPVVMLTTSSSEEDILRSYGLHANCYVVKPVGLEGFLQAVQSIDNFWLSVVTLPREVPDGS